MNWQALKSLYDLFENGKIKSRPGLVNNTTFQYHARQTKELIFTKKEIIVKNKSLFDQTFNSRYLNKYHQCLELLNNIGENTPHCRFEIGDIQCLIDLKRQMDMGELEDIRRQIIDSNETRRGVSLMFFKNEKHLDSSHALERAVKKILNIETFADTRDFQYLYVLQCHAPSMIVLCENLYFLKMPGKARKNHIELWYAGGRNIEKLVYTDNRDLPIYYLCDWDHDGLDIYRSVREKIPHIQLLTPNGDKKDIVQSEHKSLWRYPELPSRLSGLPGELYTNSQRKLIETLIKENSWIVEESNNLVTLTSTSH